MNAPPPAPGSLNRSPTEPPVNSRRPPDGPLPPNGLPKRSFTGAGNRGAPPPSPGPGTGPRPPPGSLGGRGGPPPSPPTSIGGPGRSSAGGPGDRKDGPPGPGRNIPPHVLEQQLGEHHRVLKNYLAQTLLEDKSYQHNRARDKLLRLSGVQFQELSTDVYDELVRREDERRARDGQGPPHPVPRFLPEKSTFHPKRNQARQKLSTLQVRKFRELATDVLYELERRFPKFASRGPPLDRPSRPPTSGSNRPPTLGADSMRPRGMSNSSQGGPYSPAIFGGGRTPSTGSSNEYGRPMVRQFQSNTMVPNKGTMVEDDDDNSVVDDDDPYNFDDRRSSRRTTNRSLPYGARDPNVQIEQQEKISELEKRIAELEGQVQERDQKANSTDMMNESLKNEIENLKSAAPVDNGWEERYKSLEQELSQQKNLSDQVREDATRSLQEMRDLQARAVKGPESEARLQKQVEELQESMQMWKTRYTKVHSQLRKARTSSIGLHSSEDPSVREKIEVTNALSDPRGMIQGESISAFQISVDELLRVARTEDFSAPLEFMHTIVSAVRGITGDVDKSAKSVKEDEETLQKRMKLKQKISAATNNLISTAKKHAQGSGTAPVGLIDVAVEHLTTAVIALVRLVKVKPTPDDGQDESF